MWEAAITSERHRPPVWLHGDIAAGNLLVRGGRLHAVIDFGCCGVGDLAIGWTLFSGDSRRAFRDAARRRCRHVVARGGLGVVEGADPARRAPRVEPGRGRQRPQRDGRRARRSAHRRARSRGREGSQGPGRLSTWTSTWMCRRWCWSKASATSGPSKRSRDGAAAISRPKAWPCSRSAVHSPSGACSSDTAHTDRTSGSPGCATWAKSGSSDAGSSAPASGRSSPAARWRSSASTSVTRISRTS